MKFSHVPQTTGTVCNVGSKGSLLRGDTRSHKQCVRNAIWSTVD